MSRPHRMHDAIVLRLHKNYIVRPAINAQSSHIQRLRIYLPVHRISQQLSELGSKFTFEGVKFTSCKYCPVAFVVIVIGEHRCLSEV